MKKIFSFFYFVIFFSFLKSGFVCAEINTNNSSALFNFYNSTKGPLCNNNNSKLFTTPQSTGYAIDHVAPANFIPSLINKKISSAFTYSIPVKTFITSWFNTHGKYITGKIFEIKESATGKNKNTIKFYLSRYANVIYIITSAGEKKRRQTLTLSKE